MRKAVHIALLALFAHAAFADAVYPNVASNYFFVTPWHTNAITGQISGYTPSYLIPRIEDAYWVYEALYERESLSVGSFQNGGSEVSYKPQFGTWPISETNRFHHWTTAVDASGTTNIVIGYVAVTNTPSTETFPATRLGYWAYTTLPWSCAIDDCDYDNLSSSSYYYNFNSQWLDPDTELRDQLDYLEIPSSPSDWPTETNLFYVTTIDASSNPDASSAWWQGITTNATSYVTTSLTNGTQSVHTNQWTVTRFWPRVSILSTNVYTYSLLDYCQASTSTHFPRLMVNDVGTTNNLPEVIRYNYSRRWTEGLYHTYDSFRRTTRLADGRETATNGTDNTFIRDTHEKWWRNGSVQRDVTSVYTNSSPQYVFTWGRSKTSSTEFNMLSAYVSRQVWASYFTRFESQLITTGGVQRVELEAAYILAGCTYSLYVNSSKVASFTDRKVLIPVAEGACRLVIREGSDPALAEIQMSVSDIATIAFGFLGTDIPPYDPLNSSLEPTTAYGDNFSQGWQCYPLQAVFIYKITPYSKFASW